MGDDDVFTLQRAARSIPLRPEAACGVKSQEARGVAGVQLASFVGGDRLDAAGGQDLLQFSLGQLGGDAVESHAKAVVDRRARDHRFQAQRTAIQVGQVSLDMAGVDVELAARGRAGCGQAGHLAVIGRSRRIGQLDDVALALGLLGTDRYGQHRQGCPQRHL